MTSDENQDQFTQDQLAQDYYLAGTDAFERGRYRQAVEALEKAVSLSGEYSTLGGEAQIWLVNAYEAADQHPQAIALCERLSSHPSFKVRKQSRRLLYILKAPRLKIRPEWLSQIPDLSNLDEAGAENQIAARPATTPNRPRPAKPKPEPEWVDLSQVNTKENGFIWVALVAIGLTIAGLIWFSL